MSLAAAVAAHADPFAAYLGKYTLDGAVEIKSEGGAPCDWPVFARLASVEFVSHGNYSSVLVTGGGSRAGFGLDEYSHSEGDDPSAVTKSENTGGTDFARNTRTSFSRYETERALLQIRRTGGGYQFDYSLEMYKGKHLSGSCTYRAQLHR
jgi:hypothetical protein